MATSFPDSGTDPMVAETKRARDASVPMDAPAMRILHILDHSVPQQSGYASRSHSILTALARMGVQVEAVTSPKHGSSGKDYDDIDSIRYRRTAGGEAAAGGALEQIATIYKTRNHLRRLLRDSGAALLHAHSPCLNGIAGMASGRPLVYEMRSSWEDAAVSSGTTIEGSLRYRASRALETFVARRADAVTVICDGLKDELTDRGIAAEKITVVPNALPEEMFELYDAKRSAALQQRFGLRRKPVIGFFGSFFEWEGVELLLEAMPRILARIPGARLLLAGSGPREQRLQQLIDNLGLRGVVTFAGRVDAQSMRDFYGAADVMVYPRLSNRLTETVTPLKPLEAMAQERPVVASDVGGHRELIDNDRTGFLFAPNDAEALAAKVAEVLAAGPRIETVVRAARQFVERERRWSAVCKEYLGVYERLLGRQLLLGASPRDGVFEHDCSSARLPPCL